MRFCILATLFGCGVGVSAAAPRPHIIWVVADDLGWNDVPFTNGTSEILTPHLSRLASEGVVLQNYYVNPICTPTRASFMTGRYPSHLGLNHGVIRDAVRNAVPLNETMIPALLREVGYRTHIVGKWHLGFYQPRFTPERRGFDTHYGYYTGNEEYWNHTSPCWGAGNYTALDLHNSTANSFEAVTDQSMVYSTNMFTSACERIIAGHDVASPLFLYAAFEAVHGASSCYVEGGPPNCETPDGDELQAPLHYIQQQAHIKDPFRRTYGAMVGALDEAVGNITAALSARGMAERSVLLFTTDNGAPSGHFNARAMSNWPLRGGKGQPWEGGVKGVGMLWGMGIGKKGHTVDALIHATDWLPTFAVLGGASVPPKSDGFDVWSAITEGTAGQRTEIVYDLDPLGDDTHTLPNGTAALRVGDWKYIEHKTGVWGPDPRVPGATPEKPSDPKQMIYLFNIRNDPQERTNLIADPAHAADLANIRRRLDEYRAKAVPCRDPDPDPKAKPATLTPSVEFCTPAPVNEEDPSEGSKPILCGNYGIWKPWVADPSDESSEW